MKLGPIKVSLAKPTPPQTGVEVGTSANGVLPSIFGDEFIDTSKIKVADFKKMLDNDGTVQALYNTKASTGQDTYAKINDRMRE